MDGAAHNGGLIWPILRRERIALPQVTANARDAWWRRSWDHQQHLGRDAIPDLRQGSGPVISRRQVAQVDGIDAASRGLRCQLQQGEPGACRVGHEEQARRDHHAVAAPTTPVSGLLEVGWDMLALLRIGPDEMVEQFLRDYDVPYRHGPQAEVLVDVDVLGLPRTFGLGTEHGTDEALDWSEWIGQWCLDDVAVEDEALSGEFPR